MKPTIELSIRLLDHWYDDHNQRRNKWHACLKGQLGIWACGLDPEDAINDLISAHDNLFPGGRREVEVIYMGGQTR